MQIIEANGNQNNKPVKNKKKKAKKQNVPKAQQARSGGERVDFNSAVSEGNFENDNEHIVLEKKTKKQLLQDIADKQLTDEAKSKIEMKAKQSKMEIVKEKQQEKIREESMKKKNYLKNINDRKSTLGEVKKKYYEKLIAEKKEAQPKEDPRPKLHFVKVDNIPFGWVKQDVFKFAKQFGGLMKILMPSSIVTKRDYGYAYLGFLTTDVAKIFVDTMDGYILFNKRLTCKEVNIKSFERAQRKRTLAELRHKEAENPNKKSQNKFMVMKRFQKEEEWKKQLSNVHPSYISKFEKFWTGKKNIKELQRNLRTFKY